MKWIFYRQFIDLEKPASSASARALPSPITEPNPSPPSASKTVMQCIVPDAYMVRPCGLRFSSSRSEACASDHRAAPFGLTNRRIAAKTCAAAPCSGCS